MQRLSRISLLPDFYLARLPADFSANLAATVIMALMVRPSAVMVRPSSVGSPNRHNRGHKALVQDKTLSVRMAAIKFS